MRETVDMRLRHDRYVMVAIRDVHDGIGTRKRGAAS